ncbi:MAG: CUB domain-containing protein [Bacteroidia bacterium]|jgi:hypothetical protein
MTKFLSAILFSTVLFSQAAMAQFCSGTIVKNTASGTFTDGSGSSNYTDNSDCFWLIAPPGAGSITLSFTGVFDLEVYNCSDKITVYDGADTTASVIAVLCGNNTMTPPTPVTGTSNNMLVRFTSDYSYNNAGWSASYTTTVAPPVYCSGQNTLTAASGNFSDGSGNSNNYGDNANCSWLIEPVGASTITVSFSAFDTEAGMDFVKIYDNSVSPASQIASFSGNSLPSATTVNSGSVLVEFTSNNTTTAPGWDASYTSTQIPPPPPVACSGSVTLTAPAGTFDDGSGSSTNYGDNADCSWIINPAGVASITITFGSFDIQSSMDQVQVYNNSTNPATLMGAYSGSTIPAPVTIYSDNVLVTFTSDGATNAAGWGASYTSSNSGLGIADANSNVGISVYPNPFHHTTTLQFATPLNEVSELVVYDVYGKSVKKVKIPAYTSTFTIDGSAIANGMYFYSVTKNSIPVHTGKLILE